MQRTFGQKLVFPPKRAPGDSEVENSFFPLFARSFFFPGPRFAPLAFLPARSEKLHEFRQETSLLSPPLRCVSRLQAFFSRRLYFHFGERSRPVPLSFRSRVYYKDL